MKRADLEVFYKPLVVVEDVFIDLRDQSPVLDKSFKPNLESILKFCHKKERKIASTIPFGYYHDEVMEALNHDR